MNYRRVVIVAFVVALAAFSFYHLSTAGSDYQFLTTSDSGFFHGIADDIDDQNGFIEKYELSHPPQGKPVGKSEQFQPLMLVGMYRGLHAVDSGISLVDVSKYFSPFLFALAVIGAFLAARELGGDLAGCTSSLLISTLVGSIYWTKIGAFDREITLIFFGVWMFYLLAKVYKAREIEILKYSVIAGLLYGLFLITWSGAPFLAVIFGLALVLVILEKAIAGLGMTLVGILLFVLGRNFSGFDVPELIGIFVFLAGIVKIAMDWDSLKKIEKSFVSSFKSNAWLIAGIAVIFAVSTAFVVSLGGNSPDFWTGIFGESIPGFLGAGGDGGASFPRIATEMSAVSPSPGAYYNNLIPKLYDNPILTGVTLLLVIFAVVQIFKKTRRRDLMVLSWIIIVAPMPLSQARFFRLFWPMWPVIAGLGFGALVWMGRKGLTSVSVSDISWIKRFKHPLALALIATLLIVPFVQNVRANSHASKDVPYPHGASLPSNYYHSLNDSFKWIKDNTPENSVIAIPWSYGHFATGATDRPSVTDGAQTMGWRDEWEDSPGIKPPDYIRYVSGNKGYIIGRNTPAESYQINGRRIDIQRMTTMSDEKEFAWLVNTYRENYDLKMDYIVFNNSVSGSMTSMQSALLSLSENMETTNQRQENGSTYTFNFEEENIKFNFAGAPVTEDDNEKLAGFIYYQLPPQGSNRAGTILNYYFTDSPDKSELLWVFFSSQQGFQIQGAGKSRFNGIPMLVRALEGYDMPDYLKKAYSSDFGQAEVYNIVHENIPEYLPE